MPPSGLCWGSNGKDGERPASWCGQLAVFPPWTLLSCSFQTRSATVAGGGGFAGALQETRSVPKPLVL